MPSNYDNSAWFYDRLSRLIFGNTLVNAQTALLYLIPQNSHVLIVGGGTGWILDQIAKQHPSGLKITYVEISAKMLQLAKQRDKQGNEVTYINLAVEDADLPANYDVVITPFLLDSLSPHTFDKAFNSLYCALNPGGLWLNTDFQLTGRWWQKPLLKTMYLFFKIIGCVDIGTLPQIKKAFEAKDLKMQTEKTFFGNFIASAAYIKKQGI